MDQTRLVIPLRPGARASAQGWVAALASDRADERARSERRTGIARQSWLVADGGRDLLIGTIEAGDVERAMRLLAISMDPFDLWFKRSFGALTGVELNDPPATDIAALLAAYATDSARAPEGARASPIA